MSSDKDSDPFRARAISLYQKGKLSEAESLCREMLARNPNDPLALHLLGVVEYQWNNPLAAIALIERAVELDPRNADCLSNYGVVLQGFKRFDDALVSYDRALALKPDDVRKLCNRGSVLLDLKRYEDAISSFDRALTISPGDVRALNSRSHALLALKRYGEALVSYDRALAIKPDHVEALTNRGVALIATKRRLEALASCDRALAIKPDHAPALNKRGQALHGLNRLPEARESYERALAIAPHPVFHSSLIFILNFLEDATAELQQAERSRWHELHAQRFAPQIRRHDNDPDPSRRLRIGYVSSHFCNQAATYAFGGVILCRDRESFDVVCYSDTSKEDEVTARFKGSVDKWHSTASLSDEELAELIRSDCIDILVDCVGHMDGNRLLVFARKPAPIQVTAWGEPTGTGLKTMDYLLADPVLVPRGDRSLLVERVFDLPNFLGYWLPIVLPPPVSLPAIATAMSHSAPSTATSRFKIQFCAFGR